MKSISFLVCPNGFGHLKRVLKISSVLINYDVKLNVLCNKKCIDNLSFFADASLLKNKKMNFLEINFPAYGNWFADSNRYDFYEYKSWIDNLDSAYIQKSDLLVSDNLAGVLARRQDAILEGSFLWNNVMTDLPGRTDELNKIIEFENDLLQKATPEMICNEDFVMPAILEQTNYKKFAWTCEDLKIGENIISKRIDEIKIFLTGGGTGSIDNDFEQIISKLSGFKNVSIYTDNKLFNLYSERYNNLIKFGFSDEEFSMLSFVICRPGIGILTDCVKYSLPVVPLANLNEENNKEMKFNYNKLLELNLGITFNALLEFLSNTNLDLYEQIFHSLSERNKNGHIKISEYLINKLNKNN